MRIFVSSTCLDYEKRRKAIYELIKGTELIPIMTDSPHFIAIQDEHSHDVCIKNIDSADFFILIIQSSSGQLYLGEKFPKYRGITITHAELKRAIELNKTIITFGDVLVYNERHIFKHDPSFKPKSDVETFLLWDEITRLKKNNWIFNFENEQEFQLKIKNVIYGLSNFHKGHGIKYKNELVAKNKKELIPNKINLLSSWKMYCDNIDEVNKFWTFSIVNNTSNKISFKDTLVVPFDKSYADFQLISYKFYCNKKEDKGMSAEIKLVGNPIHSHALIIKLQKVITIDPGNTLEFTINFKHGCYFKKASHNKFIHFGFIHYLDYPELKFLDKTQTTVKEYFVSKELLSAPDNYKLIKFNPRPDWQYEMDDYYVYGFERSFSNETDRLEVNCSISI